MRISQQPWHNTDEDDDDNENDGWQTIIRLSNELKWWTPFITLQFRHLNMQFQMVYGSESKEKNKQ